MGFERTTALASEIDFTKLCNLIKGDFRKDIKGFYVQLDVSLERAALYHPIDFIGGNLPDTFLNCLSREWIHLYEGFGFRIVPGFDYPKKFVVPVDLTDRHRKPATISS